MHQLLISLFAFVFSFGHAQTVRQTEAQAFIPPASYSGGLDFAVPTHRDVVSGRSSYSGAACTACRTTNATLVKH